MTKKYVYVAGPIGKGPKMHRNVLDAIDVLDAVRNLGAYPYSPHLSFYWNIVHPRGYEDWMDLDFEWIRKCDVLLRMPGISPGSDREAAFAREIGIPVVFSVDELQRLMLEGTNEHTVSGHETAPPAA